MILWILLMMFLWSNNIKGTNSKKRLESKLTATEKTMCQHFPNEQNDSWSTSVPSWVHADHRGGEGEEHVSRWSSGWMKVCLVSEVERFWFLCSVSFHGWKLVFHVPAWMCLALWGCGTWGEFIKSLIELFGINIPEKYLHQPSFTTHHKHHAALSCLTSHHPFTRPAPEGGSVALNLFVGRWQREAVTVSLCVTCNCA